jgi:hypothetical protein
MPWNDAAATDLTIPTDGAAPDPYIYLGPDDPAAEAAGIDASIVFHFGNTGAYILGVTQEELDPDIGHFNLRAANSDVGGTDYDMIYSDYSSSTNSIYVYFGSTNAGCTTVLQGYDVEINYNTSFDVHDMTINGRSYPRGLISKASRASNSAAIGNTETVMLTAVDINGGGQPDYDGNRAFRAKFVGGHDVSVAASDSTFRIRKTNTAGQVLAGTRFTGRAATTSYYAGFEAIFTTGAFTLFGTDIVLTLQGSAAHNSRITASATGPSFFTVEDIGHATDYPDAPVLV